MGNMCDMTLCKKHKAGIDSCIKANKCYIQCQEQFLNEAHQTSNKGKLSKLESMGFIKSDHSDLYVIKLFKLYCLLST